MSDRIVNRHEIRVIGLSRSGNHAILNWIYRQTEGRVCLLNCVEGKSNPYLTARPLDDGVPCRATYHAFDLAAEQRGRWTRKDLLLFNHEDGFLGHACSDEYERHHDAWVGPSGRRTDVLILRDPFNLFASRRGIVSAAGEPVAVRMWKQHARQFLGRPRMLRHDPVCVLFNRWAEDRDYRRQIAERLGLTFTDAGRDEVVACHGGSSVDGLRYDGEARKMRVNERWRHAIDDPAYRALLDDEQLLIMARRIFGELPALERVAAVRSR